MIAVYICIFIISLIEITKASVGDKSQFYSNCNYRCFNENCDEVMGFKENPPLDLRLLFWTCKENCSYMCMWETTRLFIARGYHVPQFHGKWPFIRIFGLQEPASVLFSIFNFFAHANYYLTFKKKTNSSSPMFFVWTWFSVICLHGWLWSTIFHARDNDFTEAMDYSCAFSMVLTLLYGLLLRLFYKDTKVSKKFIVITSIYVTILFSHLTHLWSGQIDYSYNMRLNIIIGFLTFVIGVIWWYRNHKRLPHIYLLGWFIILTVLVTILEVADFSPIFWTFDAHSLWHASTIPLVKLLYRFISLDCEYLRRQYSKLEDDRL